MKLLIAIVLFVFGLASWLSLIYVFNYALVAVDGALYDLIPTDFLITYRIFNIIWSAMPFLGILKLLIDNINKEGEFG